MYIVRLNNLILMNSNNKKVFEINQCLVQTRKKAETPTNLHVEISIFVKFEKLNQRVFEKLNQRVFEDNLGFDSGSGQPKKCKNWHSQLFC